MLALAYHGPHDLRLEERPLPALESGDVLVRVLAAGICGTDLRILHGAHRAYPEGTVRVPGHELVGEVVEAGGPIAGLQPHARVIVSPNWGCGRCRQCIAGQNNRCASYGAIGITLDGGFAAYVRVPAAAVAQGNLIPCRDDVDPALATLVEPLACVVRGQAAMGGVQAGETVLVMGAGPIGVMHTMLARLQGAGVVIVAEMAPARLENAKRAGADVVVDLQTQNLQSVLDEVTGRLGAGAVIVAAPSGAAQQSALEVAALGGRVAFFGGLPRDKSVVPLDGNLIHYKELHVSGTSACSTANCWEAAAIVQSGRLDLGILVTDRFPLRESEQAFARAERQQGLKVVLEA